MTENPVVVPNEQRALEETRRISIEEPVYEQDMLRRFRAAKIDDPIILFVPWGVRPSGTAGDSEYYALDRLSAYQQTLQKNNIPSQVLVMPADVYAIEINGYPWEMTTRYFNWVWDEANQRGFQVKPWSIIRSENQERYEGIAYWEANMEILWRSIPKALWYRNLLSAAYRRSIATSDEEVRESAFQYLRERIIEARIIDAIYTPIKISMVSPEKDDIVDGPLPRLYLLPKEMRFPWLQNNT